MTRPIASIVVPVFNAENYLGESIGSLLAQTYRQVEVLAIDDGSTDASLQTLQQFVDDPRLRILSQENSGGPSGPRNRGIEEAWGDYIFFFDADDLAMPTKVEESIKCFEKERQACGFVVSDFDVIDGNGNHCVDSFLSQFTKIKKLTHQHNTEGIVSLDPRLSYDLLLRGNFVGTSSVAIRKSVLETVGDFDETLKNGDDYELWLRVVRQCGLTIVNKVLHTYRRADNGISNRSIFDLAPNRISVLERQFRYGLSPGQCRIVRSNIAANYESMAWQSRVSGDLDAALRFYRLSLKSKIAVSSIRGLLITVLCIVRRASRSCI